ncbi:amino acid adenylation domain-containing protein [Streptomyces diastaticus]|uniref:amino acid adenylation domain-containing protein n=1 Tax=Streptomyces diastaticus TaxID=1956 RepID=UPI0033C94CB8
MSRSTIHGLIAARARSTPGLPAVEYGDECLDFRELERRSDAAARRLSAHGVAPGVFVAVSLERSAAMVVTLLGILKAGGSYVALDPAYPEARLRWILEDIAPRLAVASRAMRDTVPPAGIPLLVAEELDDASPAHGTDVAPMPGEPGAVPSEGDPERLAFITYTSGTTGRPKGVMHVHDSMTYFMEMIEPYLGLAPGTRFLQFYPLTWEIQALDIYAVLAAGGTVVIPPAGTETAGPGLVRFLRDARVTTALLPPALLAELAEEPPLPALHTLAYIGERCRPRTAERWGSGRRLINLYGPTEVTVAASASDERPPGDAPPIGKALPGRELHVLDEQMNPVAEGAPGELHVGGRGLARGYWKLPELTERQFPQDPFSGRPGSRLYRTGDRVRYLPDGNLEFLGRVDGQLNVRGQRVERGEIEAVMAAHPGVRSCAVVVQGEGSDARLVGFVVGTPGVEKELGDRLADELPPAMVPSFLVPLERLPLNQHGKVDLAALRAHRRRGAGSRVARPAPRPGPEADLARIWEEVLEVEEVGPEDGFRALGGTSLQAIRAQNRIREHFGVPLTVRELVGAGTLADLARLLAAGDAGRGALPPLTRTAAGPSHPASLHQRRLWAQARAKQAASVAYNETSALHITGPVDLSALRRAVQDLADRHEAFRSSLHLDGADLRVDIAAHVTVELAEEDLTGTADPFAAATRRVAELGAVPFDLERAPLLRATLLDLGAETRVLVLVTHHTVADGLSQDVLDHDLAQCYAARGAGREPAPRPGKELRPRDHALWQRTTAGHPVLAAGLDHWRAVLDGAPTVTNLSTAGTRSASFSHLGGRVNHETGPELRAAVERLAKEAGTTPYAVCLLALAVLVSRRTGQRDVLIGSPFSGRPSQEAEDVIGFFTNTVVMRVRLDGRLDPLPLLGAVDERIQEGLEHQYVAFNDVVRAVGARGGTSGQPLVQVVLAYQGPLRPRAALTGAHVVPWLVDNGTAKADLTVEINEVGDELVVVLPYSADVMDEPVAARTLAEYVEILRELTVPRPDTAQS